MASLSTQTLSSSIKRNRKCIHGNYDYRCRPCGKGYCKDHDERVDRCKRCKEAKELEKERYRQEQAAKREQAMKEKRKAQKWRDIESYADKIIYRSAVKELLSDPEYCKRAHQKAQSHYDPTYKIPPPEPKPVAPLSMYQQEQLIDAIVKADEARDEAQKTKAALQSACADKRKLEQEIARLNDLLKQQSQPPPNSRYPSPPSSPVIVMNIVTNAPDVPPTAAAMVQNVVSTAITKTPSSSTVK